jgi:hypothetical protein
MAWRLGVRSAGGASSKWPGPDGRGRRSTIEDESRAAAAGLGSEGQPGREDYCVWIEKARRRAGYFV